MECVIDGNECCVLLTWTVYGKREEAEKWSKERKVDAPIQTVEKTEARRLLSSILPLFLAFLSTAIDTLIH